MANSKYKKFFLRKILSTKSFLRKILSTRIFWLQILSTKRVWWQIQSTKSFWWCWDRGMGCTFLKLGIVPDNCAEHTRICQLSLSAKKIFLKTLNYTFLCFFARDHDIDILSNICRILFLVCQTDRSRLILLRRTD